MHCCGSARDHAASSQVQSVLALLQPGSWPCWLSHSWREGGPVTGACWGAPAGLPAPGTQQVLGEQAMSWSKTFGAWVRLTRAEGLVAAW